MVTNTGAATHFKHKSNEMCWMAKRGEQMQTNLKKTFRFKGATVVQILRRSLSPSLPCPELMVSSEHRSIRWVGTHATKNLLPLWVLAFLDDIGMVTSTDRTKAPSILRCVQHVGLQLYCVENNAVVNPAIRRFAPSCDKLEVQLRFECVEQPQYVRKPFGYHLDAGAMTNENIQPVHAA